MGISSREAWKILDEKRKYWTKTVKRESFDINLLDFFRKADEMYLSFDMVTFDSIFSSLISAVLFDTPLSDVEPINLHFEIELPSPEEFAKGKLLNIERVSLTDVLKEENPVLYQYLTNLDLFLETHFGSDIAKNRPRKGVYGLTKYDESYYDPPLIREFLRAAMYRITKRFADDMTLRAELKAVCQELGMAFEVCNRLFIQLVAITKAKEKCGAPDYIYTDYTEVSEEPDQCTFKVKDLNGEEITVGFHNWTDLAGGNIAEYFIPDLTVVTDELGYLVDIPGSSPNWVPNAVGNYLMRKIRTRLYNMPLLVANYNPHEARENMEKSVTTTRYGTQRGVFYKFRSLVLQVLRDKPAFERNLYVTALRNLYSKLTSVHQWGKDVYRMMDVESVKRAWLEEWSAKGLDRSILEKLLDMTLPMILSQKRVREQEKQMRDLMFKAR